MTETSLAEVLGGRPCRFFPRLESTNSTAVEWVKNEAPPSGSLVVADEQTAGRGRFNRRWMTPAGASIAMSVILDCNDPRYLAPAAGLAVADTVSPLVNGDVELKWPNDVEIDGKKLAGILIEAVSSTARPPVYVVGIGMNVELPPSLDFGRAVTSLAEHRLSVLGTIQRERLVAETAEQLENRLNGPEIFAHWKERLNTLGRRVRVVVFNGSIEGTAVDVDGEGRLVVRDDGGQLHHLSAGDVTISSDRL